LSGRRPGHSRSRVPLHVQHPEKYTCYVLDEPLVVGGGDKAAGLSSQAELEKVRMPAMLQFWWHVAHSCHACSLQAAAKLSSL